MSLAPSSRACVPAAGLLIALLAAPAAAQPDSELTGGTGTIYVGGYPNRIFVIDEATEQVVDDITMQLDGPPNGMQMSEDRSRLYMRDRTFEQIEIFDVATRRTIDTLMLSDGNSRVRIRSFRAAPDHASIVLLTDTATKLADRFEIPPRQLVQVDLATKEVVQEVPWPDGREQIRVNMLFSPDGDLLYLFGDEIVVLETGEFTEVERWELSQATDDGLGRFNFGFRFDPNEEPGYYTNIFRVRDPVQNRTLMGIARINLAEHDLDFYTLGPSQSLQSFALAPGRQKAYAMMNGDATNSSQIGHYEFWTFDLAGRRLENRQVFEGRPRMAVTPSTNGQLLYVHQAGATIDLYEAATYRYLRTIDLAGDMTQMFVVP
jgi:hypothetical protein